MSSQKKKIVILGGGLGSLTTAYWLTEKPGWKKDYSITIYQMGWRLGGKGASGRSVKPGYGQRIEEHGYHVWFGFYENAFKMMRNVYAQLAASRSSVRTFASCDEAFSPRNLWTLEQRIPGGKPHWPVLFPTNSGVPGSGSPVWSWALVQNLVGWMKTGRRIFFRSEDTNLLMKAIDTGLRAAGVVLTSAGFTGTRTLQTLGALLTGYPHHPSRRGFFAGLIREIVDSVYDDIARDVDDAEAERVRVVLDIAGTCIVGILDDDLLKRGFEAADDEDFREWLARHGADQASLDSHLLRQVYDLAFGYANGSPQEPNLGAGSAVRGLLRFLITYKGSVMYEMQAGMGDTLFVPLYALLKERGVKIEFFHRLQGLRLDPATPQQVDRIELVRQARVKSGEYEPFVHVHGLDCWPSEPKYSLLVDGEQLEPDYASLEASVGHGPQDEPLPPLERGKDFDQVVLGIPVEVLPTICRDLIAVNENWADMVRNVHTTATYGIQLWLKKATQELGWDGPDDWMKKQPAEQLSAILCGYHDDLNTWADMSHLIEREDWPAAQDVKSIQYFCGTFDARGEETIPEAEAAIQYRGVHALQHAIRRLWRNGLDPSWLVDPEERSGTDRFDAQWWRANTDPSERYTLTLKGSTKHRLNGVKCGFDNLLLSGDWTMNRVLNVACVEATVAAGMEISRAICGLPNKIIGERAPQVSDEKWSHGLLDRLRREGDPEGDAWSAEFFKSLNNPRPSAEMWRKLGNGELISVPVIVHDPEQACGIDHAEGLAPGPRIFADYGPEIMLILALYSLPAAFAARRGAQVLGRTEYLMEAPKRRLFETAQMVIDVMTPHGMDAGGNGVDSSRRVRLFHAAIRHLLLNDLGVEWDEANLGKPINQEDLLGTLMTFSWVTLDGLDKLGFRISKADQNAYLEVWKRAATELGIPRAHFPADVDEAKRLTFAIHERQFRPQDANPHGRALTRALVDMMEDLFPGRFFDPAAASMMRVFLPPPVADSLGIPRRIVSDNLVKFAIQFSPLLDRIFRGSGAQRVAFRRLTRRFIDGTINNEIQGRTRFEPPRDLRDRWWKARFSEAPPPRPVAPDTLSAASQPVRSTRMEGQFPTAEQSRIFLRSSPGSIVGDERRNGQ